MEQNANLSYQVECQQRRMNRCVSQAHQTLWIDIQIECQLVRRHPSFPSYLKGEFVEYHFPSQGHAPDTNQKQGFVCHMPSLGYGYHLQILMGSHR